MAHENEPQMRSMSLPFDSLRSQAVGAVAAVAAGLGANAVMADRVSAGQVKEGVVATQNLDGKEFEAYPGDESARANEAIKFNECWENDGHTSYYIKKVSPNSADPVNKGKVRAERIDVSNCDDYVVREISKVVLMTQAPGQKRWKSSRVPTKSLTTNEGRDDHNLRPLDWGQKLAKGKSLKVKVKATTTVTNTTANVSNVAVGEQQSKTRVISDVFKVKR